MRLSLRVYRLLLRLYPAGFREEYGAPLQRQFKDDYRDVRTRSGLFAFWARTALDFLRSMPAQLLRELAQDGRHAVRGWRRRPLQACFMVIVLAVGVGATTGVFSVLNGAVLRSLPFNDPERLVALHNFAPPAETAVELDDWRRRGGYLSDAASFLTFDANWESSGRGARISLSETSSTFFSLLGVPVQGRAFALGEDLPGKDAVAVISYACWHRLFGGEFRAIGSSVRVNGTPLTVIGIAPWGFDYPAKTDVWSPTRFDLARIPKTGSAYFFTTIGRLTTGLTLAAAQHGLEAEAFQRFPERLKPGALDRPELVRLRDQLAGPVKQASMVLMVGVALLLLLTCANVSTFFLARTASRSGELLIRSAVGASRARLTQQLLTESVLLSTLAAACGLLVAVWVARTASSAQPPSITSQSYAILDLRVLAFAALVSVGTGVTFGIWPALHVTRRGTALLARAGAPRGLERARNVLIGAHVAVAVILLTGSLALGRAFQVLMSVDNGYEFRTVATMTVSLAGTQHEQNGAAGLYYEQVSSRLRAIPGVVAVGATESLPLSLEGAMAAGFTVDHVGNETNALILRAAPGYFKAIGADLLAGREFAPEDVSAAEGRAVVTDEFARRFGGAASVLGRSTTAGTWQPRRIIGVVRGIRNAGPMYDAGPTVFWLSRSPRSTTLVVRMNGPAKDWIRTIRDAVQSVDPKVPVFDVKTMDQRLDVALARQRFYTTAAIFFGGLAILLAVIGVYGLLSYFTLQRTREMGIRLALGTTPARLRARLLLKTVAVVCAGTAVGALVSSSLGRFLKLLVPGADGLMTINVGAAVVVTCAVAATAVWIATSHIARLDIAEVLRAEASD